MNTQTAETTKLDAAEEMGQVAELIERGATREARRRTARLADAADVMTRALLGEILTALEKHPAVAVPRLRHLWKVTDEDGRALVEACAPHAERRAEAAKQAERMAQSTRAERREYARRRPGAVVTSQGTPQQQRSQRATDNDTATRRYFAERDDHATADVRDASRHGAEPEGRPCTACVRDRATREDGVCDDCRRAVAPMRGLPCVAAACGVERSTRDQQRSHDDGLCEDCRDSGTAGVAILPATATRAEVLIARCEYIAATSATADERNARLNRDWRCLLTGDRFTVSDWHARQPA
ncbi:MULTISPECIES: hypothetical protein [Pseudonocardia]|uniref:Uncharacterized protein n=2 Tax=Pseudonocardia TaxID=1847 RepID=A0A1Y2MLZ7_PSEAH|nr:MULTISPECIES: hypothetical protein [Pseudonocardia]OSY35999.1 hypothetical protein BG845_05680 [Pseudonocardia autotrophica]TDN65632.1 hypothetical protein C8E95_7140 [Pseudonocardia autotrophica]BBG05780.1 hypothetical protein Pdca_69890 [Pseudonocardia autotrophica]GEC27034.1 hypothetical protein PSA01_40630 [Pseudonocardia saturnea]